MTKIQKNSATTQQEKELEVVSTESSDKMQAIIAESRRMLELDWMQEKLRERFEKLKQIRYEPFSL